MANGTQTPKEIIIFAGPNGSGKSTLAGQLDLRMPFVNADFYAASKYSHIADADTRERRVAIAVARKIKDNIINGISFAFETVFAVSRIPQFLIDAKARGYKITVHFVAVDSVATNIKRVAARVKQGGHDVPKEVIAGRHTKVMALLEPLIDFADKLIAYDNSGKIMKPFLVKENKQIKIIAGVPIWARSITRLV